MRIPGIVYQKLLKTSLGMIIVVIQQVEIIWWVYLLMWSISCSEQHSTLTRWREG